MIAPFLSRLFRTLRFPNYRIFFFSQLVSLIGVWMQQIAMIWWVYEITHSAFMLGFMGFVSQIPILFLSPIAGVWADRYSKKSLLAFTQMGFLTSAFLFATLAFFHITALPILIGLGLVFGVINAIDTPVRQAFFIELIDDPTEVGSAVALNSVAFHGTRLIGPALAGFLIHWYGPAICFGLNSASYLAVLAALFFIRPMQHHRPDTSNQTLFASLKDGLHYAKNHASIRALLVLVTLISMFGMSYVILLAAFVKDIYGGNASMLGILMSTAGIGAFCSAVYIASRDKVLFLPLLMYIGTFLLGLALIAFSKTHHPIGGGAILLLVGVCMMMVLGGSNVIIQTLVEPSYRGRVMSVYAMAFGGTTPIGNLLVGFSSSIIGLRSTFLICGFICVFAGVYFNRQLNDIGRALAIRYQARGVR